MINNNLNLESDMPTPLCTGDNSTTNLRRLFGLNEKYFGKSGFTGCQIFGNTEKQKFIVFLSNRTYQNGDINYEKFHEFRRQLIKLLFN